jgi:hypothetical protein
MPSGWTPVAPDQQPEGRRQQHTTDREARDGKAD